MKFLVFPLLIVLAVAPDIGVPVTSYIHGFKTTVDDKDVAAYIKQMYKKRKKGEQEPSSNRKLIIVTQTHGNCPGDGQPVRDSNKCGDGTKFKLEDFATMHAFDKTLKKYIEVVPYWSSPAIKRGDKWNEFMGKHSSDDLIMAWCCSACWKGNGKPRTGCYA